MSGNIDGFGNNSRVYAQIACESRQASCKSDDTLSNLITQQKYMKKNCPVGFIQNLCAKPVYVFHWSKCSLVLYHERAAGNALFWDATGSACRRTEDDKQMLYYEPAIQLKVKWAIQSLQWLVLTNVFPLFRTGLKVSDMPKRKK